MSCWFISQNYCNVCVGNINWKCEECEPLFETFPKKPGPCVLSFRNSVRHFIKIYKVIVQYVPKFNPPPPPWGMGGGGVSILPLPCSLLSLNPRNFYCALFTWYEKPVKYSENTLKRLFLHSYERWSFLLEDRSC